MNISPIRATPALAPIAISPSAPTPASNSDTGSGGGYAGNTGYGQLLSGATIINITNTINQTGNGSLYAQIDNTVTQNGNNNLLVVNEVNTINQSSVSTDAAGNAAQNIQDLNASQIKLLIAAIEKIEAEFKKKEQVWGIAA